MIPKHNITFGTGLQTPSRVFQHVGELSQQLLNGQYHPEAMNCFEIESPPHLNAIKLRADTPVCPYKISRM